MFAEYLEYGTFLLLGIAIGYNFRSSRTKEIERTTFEMVDERVRKDLEISECLNTSLRDDIKFLRENIERLNERIAQMRISNY